MTSSLAQVESLFTTPALAAAGAAAIAAPIAIHLLSRARRKREVWGAMRWLVEAYRKQRRRARLEHWLLLAVRCLVVLVLGLALAGPQVAGALKALGGGLESGGRELVLVINHGLTTAVVDAEGRSRLDRFKAEATAALTGVGPSDRVTVIASARPATVVVDAAVGPRPARDAIEQLQPIAARPDLGAALELASDRLEVSDASPGRSTVLILDDWARADGRLERAMPTAIAGMGQQASVRSTQPLPGASNVQVASLSPRRSTVIAHRAGSVLPVTVSLQRFGDLSPRSATVTLELAEPAGETVSRVERPVSFAAGQAETRATLEITAPTPAELETRTHWALRASVVSGGGDSVTFDDARGAWIDLRPRLRVVVVVGDRSAAASAGELTPAQWVTLALSPEAAGGEGRGPIAVQRVDPMALNDAVVASVDAVVVVAPSRLPGWAWPRLAEAVEAGRVLWLWPDASDETVPGNRNDGSWLAAMGEALALDWTAAAEPADAGGNGLRLDDAGGAPEAMSLLGADWSELLRPVRVSRYWPITTSDAAAVWIRLATGDPLLLAGGIGRGGVLLSTAAADPAWTNLPTKPLFVPLLHEALRGVVGGEAMPGREPIDPTVVGDRAAGRWTAVGDREQTLEDDDVFRAPGLYEWATATDDAMGPASRRRLAVHPDAAAGDTTALSAEAVERWLEPIGPWSFAEPGELAAATAEAGPRVNLAWPLLWALLGLVLLETLLSRRFSHAQTGGGVRPIAAWLWSRLWHPRGGGAAS